MGRLRRKQDWPTLLEKAIRAHDRRRFRYRWHDCCISPANCVKAMTGVDMAKEAGIAYGNEEEAEALLASYRGILKLARSFAKRFGVAAYKNPLRAKRGDVVLVKKEDGEHSLGIIDLSGQRALVAAPKGWRAYKLGDIVMAWDIS